MLSFFSDSWEQVREGGACKIQVYDTALGATISPESSSLRYGRPSRLAQLKYRNESAHLEAHSHWL